MKSKKKIKVACFLSKIVKDKGDLVQGSPKDHTFFMKTKQSSVL